MSGERASIFETDDEFDVSGFAPKTRRKAGRKALEQVRAVSEAASFRSREPKAALPCRQRRQSVSSGAIAPAATPSSTSRSSRKRSRISTRSSIARAGCRARHSSGRSRRSSGSWPPKVKDSGQGAQSLPRRLAPNMSFSGSYES